MAYIDNDASRQRPIMIHRAIFGSLERFFGILVENYAGAFPFWLAPVQVRCACVGTPLGTATCACEMHTAARLIAAASSWRAASYLGTQDCSTWYPRNFSHAPAPLTTCLGAPAAGE